MSPISDEDYNADLAAEFGFPLLVVAANVLGTINATLQTLITASTFRDRLRVAGVVLNSPTGRVTIRVLRAMRMSWRGGASAPLIGTSSSTAADSTGRGLVASLCAAD